MAFEEFKNYGILRNYIYEFLKGFVWAMTDLFGSVWLIGLAPSNPGLQELNNQLRYGQYLLPMGVDGLASLA